MASCITSQWGDSYSPQARLTVTQTSSTNTSVTLSWKLEYVAHGYAIYTSVTKDYTVKIGGSTVKSGSFAVNGVTTTKTVASGTKTINKTTSTQNVSFSVSFTFGANWSGTYAGTKTASGSISVAAKPSYKITYNANGGSGAPSAQTKWYGTNLTLSSTKPTRTGYSFLGWSTSASATSATWPAGGTYTANASDTLYAVWKANTYSVKYNANGGTGVPATQTKTYGKTLTLSSTKPTRTNYNFKGWGTSASSTTVAYAPGASYTANAAVTLYAIWELAYTPPIVENLSVDRCTLDGTLSDDGQYAKISFDWSTEKEVSSIKVSWKEKSSSSYTATATVRVSGTSGHIDSIKIGADSIVSDFTTTDPLDTDTVYTIQVVVADSQGSSTVIKELPAMTFIIDVSNGGTGLAFFGIAKPNGVSVGKPLVLTGDRTISVEDSSGSFVPIILGRDNGRASLVNHTALKNGIYLQGETSSGGFTNILCMNSSDEVELNWTKGGMGGRVWKQIWSGNWSSGTISVPELGYYRAFRLDVKSVSTGINAVIEARYFRGFGAYPHNSGGKEAFQMFGIAATANNARTTLTMVKCHYFSLYDDGTVGGVTTNATILAIYGVV